MTWVGILILIVCIWLAFKVAGVLFKIVLWGAIIVGVWWLAAPYMGLPRPF